MSVILNNGKQSSDKFPRVVVAAKFGGAGSELCAACCKDFHDATTAKPCLSFSRTVASTTHVTIADKCNIVGC